LEHELRTRIYEVKVTTDLEDRDWDRFLEKTPTGQYEQTSLWAQVKALHKWQPVRVVVYDDGKIVAGAQVLRRKIPLLGAIGYVSKGPVFAQYHPKILQDVIWKLKSIVKHYRIRYLIMNLPDRSRNFGSEITHAGFEKGAIVAVTAATVIIDLNSNLNDIFRRVKKRTREYIRRGQKKGIVVREGNRKEISVFFQLMLSTCNRQGVSPSPSTEEFFQKMWQIFFKHDYVKLFIAEFEKEIVASAFVVTFGDTVRVWKVGWSGAFSNLRPNHVLWWEIIKWAKLHGYHYFDFVGIDRTVAEAVLRNNPIPEKSRHTPSFFKLRFGGQIILLPETYSYINNPILRWGYNIILPNIREWPLAHRILTTIK